MTPASNGDEGLERFDPHSTYDSGALDYADASQDFWSFASERTVERLPLPAGAQVLDIACGPGWSALAAAAKVGDAGRVTAVDISDQMLGLAEGRSRAAGLNNIEFVQSDMTVFDGGSGSFDAVICVLGIFFVEDMAAQLRRLWGFLAPRGRLAITNLGPDVFAPLIDSYLDLAGDLRPDLTISLPWQRTNAIETNQALFAEAGIGDAEITLETEILRLVSPDDGWRMVMGSGLRRYVMEMTPEEGEELRWRTVSWIEENRLEEVSFDVIYCVAQNQVPVDVKS